MAVFSVESLPLGFRFRPTDVELVNHYLKGKISGQIRSEVEVIPEIDVCKCEPWDLPDKSLIKSVDSQWFFFAPKDRKYHSGNRSKRATQAGYWKATGRDRMIKTRSPGPTIIGMKKTLVFHRGRAPNGVRTNWIIHEYRTTESEFESGEQGGFVLCRLFKKDEEKTLISDTCDCTERNADEIESTGLSPAPTMAPPGEKQHIQEVVTALNQKLPGSDLQENIQCLSLTYCMQPSDMNRLPADKMAFTRSCHSQPEEKHCDAPIVSDVADHESDVGTEDDSLLDDFAQYLGPEWDKLGPDDYHMNSQMLPHMGYPICDEVHQEFPQELSQFDNVEQDSITDFLNAVLCNPEEFSPEVSSFHRNLITEFEADQICVISDGSAWDSLSGKESRTVSDEDTEATVFEEHTGFSGEIYRLPICSSNSLQKTSYIDPIKQGTSQFSVCPTRRSRQNVSPVDSASSSLHQESAKMDNFDGAVIQTRTRKNLSDSDYFIEQQGLAPRRLRLQKFIHNGSVPRTGHALSSTNGDMIKSTVTKVREISEHQFDEEKSVSSGIASMDAEGISSHDDTNSTEIKSSSPDFYDSKLRLRTRWTNRNEDKTRGQSLDAMVTRAGSHATITTILILSAILLFLFLGISWCLSSCCACIR